MSLIQLGLIENPQEHLCPTLRSWRIRDDQPLQNHPLGRKSQGNHSVVARTQCSKHLRNM